MRDIRSIKAAVFDLDGTLLDSTAAWEGLGERYLAGRGITPEPGLDEKLRCMALPDGSAYLNPPIPCRSLPTRYSGISCAESRNSTYPNPAETRRAGASRAALAARSGYFRSHRRR